MTTMPPQSLISAATLRWLIDRVAELEGREADRERRVAELEARQSPLPVQQDQTSADDDFAPHNLLPAPEAAHKYGVSKQCVQRLCRYEGLGVMPLGRWMVSEPRLRRWLRR